MNKVSGRVNNELRQTSKKEIDSDKELLQLKQKLKYLEVYEDDLKAQLAEKQRKIKRLQTAKSLFYKQVDLYKKHIINQSKIDDILPFQDLEGKLEKKVSSSSQDNQQQKHSLNIKNLFGYKQQEVNQLYEKLDELLNKFKIIEYVLQNFQHEQFNPRYEINKEFNQYFTLYLRGRQINMQDFITKFKLNRLEQIYFDSSKIDNQKWKCFVDNSHLFSQVKTISFSENNISVVQQSDLTRFQALHFVNLQLNPLTQKSKQNIENFKQKHRNIKVLY